MNEEIGTPLHIVGGGLAGSEAAWQAARLGIPVMLHEMRGVRGTDAHKSEDMAELVCSNSFRSDDATANAVGVLHAEMRLADSLIMACGDANQVPAGSALAVDREGFAAAVTRAIEDHPLITVVREEITGLPPRDWGQTIIATGPLTAPGLAAAIAAETGQESLAFFDAIAPIVHFDTIDLTKAWFQSRYDKAGPGGSGKDYLNCPMDEAQYNAFIDAILAAEKTAFKEWENVPYFDGCLPIEVMAERGRETLRHGPMKPMGLTNAHDPDTKPYAVVQLRQDNALGTLYNMVGFQTKMKYGEQTRIFRMIPGLEEAEFARLGGIHRNTYLNSPKILDERLRLKTRPDLRFAGQITGCEGYIESASIGILAARFAAAQMLGTELAPPPITTAMGALLHHITTGHVAYDEDGTSNERSRRSFQPMNINFGLFPPLAEGELKKPEGVKRWRGKEKQLAKKQKYAKRALSGFAEWIDGQQRLLAAE
ncbi:methylenetetrahydrofolate--tRNA-(uracil(54)-C(5))-methyltransferase (FADH(2)-oxidizing) TrmFO [Salaquimonas pukyongi]|uniref:methylenetetrahydrofolate--tRNA-(uracil(54)- C(5))-methyltransferase (FADH(2)-oxidizing) TrmFO n=1 Tax=Salaquimonas pukyongi TaxID=2712698 RepID=UPI00096B6C1F|nr:methylenetetrahydrofolate--tRNA-(uracil(54)-C(5))-methyltransferase (FADH(2)-oxidizing) TrmFO [Salaquimonas pukyongi]